MDFITLTLLALTVTYLTHILLLEQKESHYGPFADAERVVVWEASDQYEAHAQPVTFFDWVRRPFGVYSVADRVWKVNQGRAERWTCPICLSFWIAAAILLLQFVIPTPIFMQILTLFSLASVASILNVNVL